MGDETYTEWSRLATRSGDTKQFWQEKAEGLACDLDSAISVMAKRVWGGADIASMGEWLSRNYGRHKAVASLRDPTTAGHIAGLKEALEIASEDRDLPYEGIVAAITARIAELEKGTSNG